MSKKYLLLFIFLFFTFSLFFPKSVFAVNTTITNYPATINESDIFKIDVLVTGATNGTNYLRVDLFKESTTNYFGETFNGINWYSGSTGTNYFPIQIINSSASATLQGRIGSPSLTSYSGLGSYKLKIRRYTSSGNVASNDVQTPVDIQIILGQQSPSPTPSLSPSPTTSPSPTAIEQITPTPTPTEPEQTETPIATVTLTPIGTEPPTIPTFSPSPVPTPLRTSAPQGHGDDDHGFQLPFGFRCGFERHEVQISKHHFNYFKFRFWRR